MAKVRITSNPTAKAKINDWKSGNNQADELIYDPVDMDGKDVQMWAFKQNVLVDLQQSTGPFMKFIFVSVLTQ